MIEGPDNAMAEETFNLVISGGRSGAYNMSADMFLLDKYKQQSKEVSAVNPTLRIYFFSPPTLSLGFSQRNKNVDPAILRRAKELGYDVVFRPTGGRAVLHKCEITYAVVSSVHYGIFAGKLMETYKIIRKFLYRFFIKLGLRPDINGISPGAGKEMIDAVKKAGGNDFNCFLKAQSFEITFSGKKICGNSQRRAGGAFLQHGSIYTDYDPATHLELFEGNEITGPVHKINNNISLSSGGFPDRKEISAIMQGDEVWRYFSGITGIKQEMERAGLSIAKEDLGFQKLAGLLAESFAETYGLKPVLSDLPDILHANPNNFSVGCA